MKYEEIQLHEVYMIETKGEQHAAIIEDKKILSGVKTIWYAYINTNKGTTAETRRGCMFMQSGRFDHVSAAPSTNRNQYHVFTTRLERNKETNKLEWTTPLYDSTYTTERAAYKRDREIFWSGKASPVLVVTGPQQRLQIVNTGDPDYPYHIVDAATGTICVGVCATLTEANTAKQRDEKHHWLVATF